MVVLSSRIGGGVVSSMSGGGTDVVCLSKIGGNDGGIALRIRRRLSLTVFVSGICIYWYHANAMANRPRRIIV